MVAFTLSLLRPPADYGYPGPSPDSKDLRSLFAQSDLVCAAEVTSVTRGDRVEALAAGNAAFVFRDRATLAIKRLYKGSTQTATAEVSFVRPGNAKAHQMPLPQLQVGEYALFFLKKTDASGGEFALTDPWFSKLHMARTMATTSPGGLDSLELDLEAGLPGAKAEDLVSNLEILEGLRSLRSTVAVERLADRRDTPVIRCTAMLTLLRVGDDSRLEQTLGLAANAEGNPQLASCAGRIFSSLELISDHTTVPILVRFINSPIEALRRGVVRALRQLNDPRSVPALVSALDDPDFYTRYDAAFTLATIEDKQNTDWINSLDGFRANEPMYLQRWKSWWRAEGSAKYTANPN